MNRANQILHLLNEAATMMMHDTLNPRLFTKNDTIKPEVRKHLLRIAEVWRDDAKIPKSAILDIVTLGGNISYAYHKLSDIDVHFVIHRKDLGIKNDDLTQEYIMTKKNLFKFKHPDLNIFGYPIEIYAQDPKTEPFLPHQGVYSLLHNKWVQKPKKEPIDFNDPHIQRKVDHYSSYIDHLISINAPDAYFEHLKDKFKNMRQEGVRKEGEYSIANLIFKELRNRGYLDKMATFKQKRTDAKLSLTFKGQKKTPVKKPVPGD